MRIKRLPMVFLIGGTVFKAVVVLLWRFFQPSALGRLIVNYDPLGIWLAEHVTPLFFDQRRIAPPPAEAMFYELVLIVAFGLQSLVIGLLLQGIWNWFRGRNAHEFDSGPQVKVR